jgi:hypothetical protein
MQFALQVKHEQASEHLAVGVMIARCSFMQEACRSCLQQTRKEPLLVYTCNMFSLAYTGAPAPISRTLCTRLSAVELIVYAPLLQFTRSEMLGAFAAIDMYLNKKTDV